MRNSFTVLTLSREDLEKFLEKDKIKKIDDGEMEYIAEKLGDALLETGYWVSLKVIIDDLFCPICHERQDEDGRCKCVNEDAF